MIMLQTKYIGLKFLGVMLNGKRRQLRTRHHDSSHKEFECDFLGSADTLISPAKTPDYSIS